MRMRTRDHHRMATETSKTTNFQARFFYKTFLYWLANLRTYRCNFFILASFFQAGERNQRNNQPVSFITH